MIIATITSIDIIIPIVIAICVSVIGGAWVGFKLAALKIGAPNCPNPPAAPQVIVNVPAEFKPMEGLPPTQIEGARAQVWYSVYKASLDADCRGW